MQGQRGAIGSFPETLGFESSEQDVVDSQLFWENNLQMQNSQTNRLSEFISSSPPNANNLYLDSTNQETPQNLNMWSVSESPASLLSLGDHHHHHGGSSSSPSFSPMSVNPARGSSSSSFLDPFGPNSEQEDRDRRLSRKRKAVELNSGQSSTGIGSSSMFQIPETGSSSSSENPNPIIPRLGLSMSRVASSSFENPISRNIRQHQQHHHEHHQPDISININNNNNRPSDVSAVNYSSLRLNNPIEFRSPPLTTPPPPGPPPADNSSSSQLSQRIPALRRNLQSTSRWSRNAHRSSSNLELDSISDHPLFMQPSNARNQVQTELNFATNNSNAAQPNPPPNRNSPHYNPRRLSAFLRRSLLSASTDLEPGSGGQNGNIHPRIPHLSNSASSSSSRDLGIPRSSVLVGRQLEGTLGIPYLSRAVPPGSEGRGRLVSEIRNVLDLMRRGEPLRFEDLMILDQSVIYGIADIHDRHRDMRLDIDNMSYEELLALEERIGNVNTGLTEETILKHLKQKKYVVESGQPETEPCCVCQEEYKDGDDLGTLECGHDFHQSCIKKWLQQKNSCPICKSTGFTSTK